jgi:hypothetical protein
MSELWNLPLAVQRTCRSCFVAIPSRLGRAVRGRSSGIVALRVEWNDVSSGQPRIAFVGWSGAIAGQSGFTATYVGSGATVAPGDDALEMPQALACSLGIDQSTGRRGTLTVLCSLAAAPLARRIEVQPVSIDDWEVRIQISIFFFSNLRHFSCCLLTRLLKHQRPLLSHHCSPKSKLFTKIRCED